MLPAYFISHGAPDIVLRETPAAQFLKGLSFPDARAILVISAHWMTEEPMLTAHPQPETIHDFGGFPKPLYALQYPSPGEVLLASETVDRLQPSFPLSALHPKRGLDHGAWIPLLLSVPSAHIPVLQLSIQPHRNAQHHYEVGKCLSELREQGVILVASGNATHNLHAAFQRYPETPPEVFRFNDWLYGALTVRDDRALQDWENAPEALWNHPTNDHFLPLLTLLGATAGSSSYPQRLHHSIDYGVLSMDCYRM